MKCEDHHTKKLIQVLPYNCLYLNKGNNSSVKGSILTKLIGYREFMVLIICTKNESNLTNRYWDMVPDRQKGWTDGRTDGMDGRTHGRRQNYIPPTSLGDKNITPPIWWCPPLVICLCCTFHVAMITLLGLPVSKVVWIKFIILCTIIHVKFTERIKIIWKWFCLICFFTSHQQSFS